VFVFINTTFVFIFVVIGLKSSRLHFLLVWTYWFFLVVCRVAFYPCSLSFFLPNDAKKKRKTNQHKKQQHTF